FLSSTGGVLNGSLTINSTAATDAVFTESGIDRNSAAAETFTIQNSGVGSMALSVEQVLTAIGTAGAPSYSFSVDTDSGVFRPGNNILALSTAAIERMRIDAIGNVAIGTTQPAGRLHIVQNPTSWDINRSRPVIIEGSMGAELALRTTNTSL